MKKVNFYPVIVLIFMLMSGCSSGKKVPTAVIPPAPEYKPVASQVVLHYKLDKKAIKDTFNQAIAELFKQNFNLVDYDLKMNFYKTKDANVEIEGKNILVNIPVGILVEKDTYLAKMKARGVLELTFITKFDLDSVWNFKAKTDLSYHKWLEKPVLSVAGINIPIEPISNVIISKAKPYIVENIDAAIAENFTIKKTIHESIQVFKDPIQLDPNNGGYLMLTPKSIKLTTLKNSKLHTSGKIKIELLSQFSTQKPITSQGPVPTPKLQWSEQFEDTTSLSLVTNIQMMDLNDIVRKNYDGKSFSAQGKTITLGSIFLNCDYENIRFVSDVTGSINGTLMIKAKPYYDAIDNTFKAKDIDISFKTKNTFHKAASWIAEGYIRKELEKMFYFPLEGQIDEIQNDINQQLDDINKEYNMDMSAKLFNIKVDRFYMKPGEIETTVKTRLMINTYIKDLRTMGSK